MKITLQEMRALVRMLEHEHFTYGDEGQHALNAFKKIQHAAETGQELTTISPPVQTEQVGV